MTSGTVAGLLTAVLTVFGVRAWRAARRTFAPAAGSRRSAAGNDSTALKVCILLGTAYITFFTLQQPEAAAKPVVSLLHLIGLGADALARWIFGLAH